MSFYIGSCLKINTAKKKHRELKSGRQRCEEVVVLNEMTDFGEVGGREDTVILIKRKKMEVKMKESTLRRGGCAE